MKERIYLTGIMGSGKSSIGKILAKECDFLFFDLDDQIEKKYGMTISEIFANKGETVFRDYEKQMLREISMNQRGIIATGGGIILRNDNIDFMRAHGLVVFIDRPLEKIISDIDHSRRPLLRDGKDKLYQIFEERIERYHASAHIVFLNDYANKLQAAQKLYEQISQYK